MCVFSYYLVKENKVCLLIIVIVIAVEQDKVRYRSYECPTHFELVTCLLEKYFSLKHLVSFNIVLTVVSRLLVPIAI